MWHKIGVFILKNRILLVALILAITAFLGYHAAHVELSYEFTKAIPTNHPANKTYQNFRQKYGQDGNLLVIGIQMDTFFNAPFFSNYVQLHNEMKKISGVTDVISVAGSISLEKNEAGETLKAVPIFPIAQLSQQQLDSASLRFYNLPFYEQLLYNKETHSWLMGVSVEKSVMNSKLRNEVVGNIISRAQAFGHNNNQQVYLSGLPLIRTNMATGIAQEMNWFLTASVILSALILLLFFRSFSSMLLSIVVVIIGVIWSLGFIHLLGFKITLLSALIPPLIVVIGIPNCIYFLNKYHTSYAAKREKKEAIISMVERMGVVTLFCNVAAAIGFAVFALTKSEILKEFGLVSGINILALFFISLVLIPVALSYLPAPKIRHTLYLSNPVMRKVLSITENWVLHYKKAIYIISIIATVAALAGVLRLKSVGYIVDDLPKNDKVYTDLKFFEKNFKGIMPLEILIDTKKKYGITRNIKNLNKLDELSQYVQTFPEIARPLSITEGLKFAKQAFFDGDTLFYSMPTENDLPALSQYLSLRNTNSNTQQNSFTKLVSSFIDSNKQEARISINMADVGSARLPIIVDSIRNKASELFPPDRYEVQFTGGSITFLEGSSYIIHGLKESILWAFLLIALCMLYLFRSWRILVCSLIPNVIPLIITAGVMGWLGIHIKPSTVLVFSVALGIAIDITIRFLVNFKQEIPYHHYNKKEAVIGTIHNAGISIIYTSLVLIAGFVIFGFSKFGGTISLGWLTSLTLITATLTNLLLLPVLLLDVAKVK